MSSRLTTVSRRHYARPTAQIFELETQQEKVKALEAFIDGVNVGAVALFTNPPRITVGDDNDDNFEGMFSDGLTLTFSSHHPNKKSIVISAPRASVDYDSPVVRVPFVSTDLSKVLIDLEGNDYSRFNGIRIHWKIGKLAYHLCFRTEIQEIDL